MSLNSKMPAWRFEFPPEWDAYGNYSDEENPENEAARTAYAEPLKELRKKLMVPWEKYVQALNRTDPLDYYPFQLPPDTIPRHTPAYP